MNIDPPSISNPGLLRSELERRVSRFDWRGPVLLASLGFAALLSVSAPALAQVPPNLGTAAPYAVLGTNAVTCTTSTINGSVGTSAASIVNTGCTITGAVDTPVAASVITDFNSAYAAIDGANPCTGTIPVVTATLPPGVYCSAAPASAGTTLGPIILTLNGNASDVWVFRVGASGLGALTLNSTQVVLGGTAQACNVFWKTEQATTLTDSIFLGTVLSGTAITMTGGSWVGRALATTSVTTTNAAPLSFAGCAAPASITVSKDFIPNNPSTVPVALSCTSGTVVTTPLNASEGAPAVFSVGGALPGATCTATETVPAGYTANQGGCVNVPLGGSCTIINALIGPPGAERQVPTLSEWAMVLLASLMAIGAFSAMRRGPR
jgi:ice-binding like protein/exosortase sorting signal-containing protein